MLSKALEDVERKVTAILGIQSTSVGKTEVRQNFLPMVDSLAQTGSAIEITDHNKPVAMLLSYNQWLAIMTKLSVLSKRELSATKPVNLIGSVKIVGDLKKASKQAADRLMQAAQESARKL